MKVDFPEKMKSITYMSEADIVETVRNTMMNENSTVNEYAEIAARCISHSNVVEIIRADAEICRNCRANNSICEGSKDFDVWITFIAIIDNGFSGIIMGGANVTDIWSITGHEETDAELRSHMYIRRFKEVK